MARTRLPDRIAIATRPLALVMALAASIVVTAIGCSSIRASTGAESIAGLPAARSEEQPALVMERLRGYKPGPTLFIVAGIHGDELSGPEAARRLADRLAAREAGSEGLSFSGTIALIPEASPEALDAGSRYAPTWSDLNRAFGTATGSGAAKGGFTEAAVEGKTAARAAAILAIITAERPDLALDLHESDGSWTEGATPALVVPRSTEAAGLALAMLESLAEREERTVPDPNGTRGTGAMPGFSFTGPPPEGSLVAALAGLSVPALIVEVPDSLEVEDRIAFQFAFIDAAMLALGMVDDVPAPPLDALQP